MVEPIFPKWTNRIPLLIAIVVPLKLVAIIAIIWYYFSPKFTDVGYQPVQPIPFSHKLHAGDVGMDCRYCHNSVERSPFAAIPTTQTCMGCHAIIRPDSPFLKPLRDAHDASRPVEWVKVHMLPDYARFDHRPHVNAGVGCVSCHSRVDQMLVVKQSQPLSMSWCLDCHRDPYPNLRPPSQVTNMTWDPAVANYDPHKDPTRTREVNPPTHCSGCHY